MPFIDELLGSINTIICDLQPQQVSVDNCLFLLAIASSESCDDY